MADKDDDRTEYEVDINGVPHSMLLSEEDAERYGDQATKAKKVSSPANKAKTPGNK